jgi:prepilin-type N-terminal cleavage/methylation domain-containing protein
MKRGFTLIELLITIAISAILVAVTLPVFTNSMTYFHNKSAVTKGGIIDSAKQLYLGDQGTNGYTAWKDTLNTADPTAAQYALLQLYLAPSYRVLPFNSFVSQNPRNYAYSFGPTLGSTVRVYTSAYVGNVAPVGVPLGMYWIDTGHLQTLPSVNNNEYQAFQWQNSWVPVDASAPATVYPK